jgi:hypothetical protein
MDVASKQSINFSHGTAKLNQEQFVVVTAEPHIHQRILASAGSGKTTTITARISYLVQNYGINPEQILLVTFSRNAAHEMIGRVRALCGPVNIWAGTFHSIAKKILTLHDYASLKDSFFIDELPVKLTHWLRTDKGRKWVSTIRYVIVDEFQDVNPIQWRLLETMRHPGVRFIIVGDDAQNIYTWRGSSARYLLEYQTVVRSVVDYQLRMNYRSTEAIVNVANRVMLKIPTLPWKQTMIPAVKGGKKPEVLFFWRPCDESKWIAKTIREIRALKPEATIAILARNNSDLYRVEEILIQECIKCRFLRSEKSNHERSSNEEVVEMTSSCIDLATFHGSKGLEWDITFCISLSDDCIPGRKNKEIIVHERRLFYVGITRARKRLFMTYHGNERHLSRFVREIGYTYLHFHGLAKYALSDVELGEQQPSLRSLLDKLDGDDWQKIRDCGQLPLIGIPKEVYYTIHEDTWKPPGWCDGKTFHAFLHLFMKRRILQQFGRLEEYQDPFMERLIFTIRIFAEDTPFWKKWQDVLNEMVREFFADSKTMPPAGYTDVIEWASKHGLIWEQAEAIQATSILAKIRGQLRPLRFDAYSLDEFTVRPARVVVPTEYRSAVLRSWRAFTNPALSWNECILDIWRLSALYQVAEGRNGGLYRVHSNEDDLISIVPYLEKVECFLGLWLANKTQCVLNPECIFEELCPIGVDMILDNAIVVFTGDSKPDLELWIETFLKAYCFIQSGTSIECIHLVNPYSGIVYKIDTIPITSIHILYKRLLEFWAS